jgi:hypothetical protein
MFPIESTKGKFFTATIRTIVKDNILSVKFRNVVYTA